MLASECGAALQGFIADISAERCAAPERGSRGFIKTVSGGWTRPPCRVQTLFLLLLTKKQIITAALATAARPGLLIQKATKFPTLQTAEEGCLIAAASCANDGTIRAYFWIVSKYF